MKCLEFCHYKCYQLHLVSMAVNIVNFLLKLIGKNEKKVDSYVYVSTAVIFSVVLKQKRSLILVMQSPTS